MRRLRWWRIVILVARKEDAAAAHPFLHDERTAADGRFAVQGIAARYRFRRLDARAWIGARGQEELERSLQRHNGRVVIHNLSAGIGRQLGRDIRRSRLWIQPM